MPDDYALAMDHTDHVELIRAGVVGVGRSTLVGLEATVGNTRPDDVWADIGAGSGAFTLALAELLGSGSRIIAIDRDPAALRENAAAVGGRFPGVELSTVVADFEAPLDLPPLDGVVAANSLHFMPRPRQVTAVRALAAHLRPGAPFVVVEYDADRGNPWVPHPFSMARWQEIARAAGLEETGEIGRIPSRFLGAIYAASSRRPGAMPIAQGASGSNG